MNHQPYNGQPPHARGSDTSLAAANEIRPRALTLKSQVFNAIRWSGVHGKTDNDLECELSMLRQTVCARRRELVLQGIVVDSGRRRLTETGRQAVIWIAKMHATATTPKVVDKPTSKELLQQIADIAHSPGSGFPDHRLVEIRVLLSKHKP